ncbi:MAG: NAD(P)/FAD-dependent oxidoreductase [Puniceicoccaceae bacterium]
MEEDSELKPLDALIVGGGLGGCHLAWMCEHFGWDYRVIHSDLPGSAWKTSPAVFSPLLGKTMRPFPSFDRYFGAAQKTYREIEGIISELVFWESPVFHLFESDSHRESVLSSYGSDLPPCVEEVLPPGSDPEGLPLPFGALSVTGGALITVPRLVEAFHRWLRSRSRLIDELFEYEYVECYEDGVVYDDLQPQVILFAEGGLMRKNPWFGAEILDLHRGEVVDLGTEKAFGDHVIMSDRWLAPVADGRYYCGGVQYPNALEGGPTPEARADLINSAEKVFNATCNPFNQQAGMIPYSTDRVPIIGPHPDFTYLQVFNGFGDVGALTMPFWAQRLAKSLTDEKGLPESVLPSRYDLED